MVCIPLSSQVGRTRYAYGIGDTAAAAATLAAITAAIAAARMVRR